MSDLKGRSSKRKKKQEATLVGDLFKILFAVSMLVVAILVAFFVFKNVDGFSLPDLRVTLAETDSNEPVTVTVAPTELSTEEASSLSIRASQSAEAESDNAEVEKNIESAEASVEAEESEKNKEDEIEENTVEENTEGSKETKSSKNKDNTETVSDRDYEESDYTDEDEHPKILPDNGNEGVITDGPVAGNDTINESPGMNLNNGIEISSDGPVVLD